MYFPDIDLIATVSTAFQESDHVILLLILQFFVDVKVVEVFTDPSAPSKAINELFR